jgi:hypothetical protein
MTNSQRITKLKGLDRAGRRELSELESCKAKNLETPHERLMWAAGFRKGLMQSLRGNRSFQRAKTRAEGTKPGDKAWARGFSTGINYVPCDAIGQKKVKKKGERRPRYTKRDLRKLTRSTG